MKKLLILLAAPLLLWSCAEEYIPYEPSEQQTESSVNFKLRSHAEILDIAKNAANLKAPTSRAQEVLIDENSVFPICSYMSRSGNPDTLLYAVDFKDNEGFVVISANQNVEPILFIADNGAFISDETRRNENFQFFLEMAKSYAQEESQSENASTLGIGTVTPSEPTHLIQYHYKGDVIGPFIKANWGQGWPENQRCPNLIAGCGPVALAQILSICAEFSQCIDITYETGGYLVNKSVDLRQLCLHINSIENKTPSTSAISSHYASCPLSAEEHIDLADLVREIGYRANARYEKDKTTTTFEDMFNLSIEMLYITLELPQMIDIDEIGDYIRNTYENFRYVAFLHGETADHEIHQWLADGIYHIITETGIEENGTYKRISLDTTRYIHHNWGFNGNSNGYCLEGVFNTKLSSENPGVYQFGNLNKNYGNNMKAYIVNTKSGLLGS